jgi:hypothetical protein
VKKRAPVGDRGSNESPTRSHRRRGRHALQRQHRDSPAGGA